MDEELKRMNQPTLLAEVASYANLNAAFRECARGKRSKAGYQKFLFRSGERLVGIRRSLIEGTFRWKGYREFTIKDPKARVILAAPFSDRIVHHAIHRVIEPILEPNMSAASFACRRGKGTSGAVVALLQKLTEMEQHRFVVKLDVEKFFATIDHGILLQSLFGGESMAQFFRDSSLQLLLNSLVRDSHPSSAESGVGIPIGNLTSQLFANWYLTPADHFITESFPSISHFRYMDDLVLVARSKRDALECAWATVEFVKRKLRLEIPFTKVMPLGADPVPFLGYLLDHNGYAILARNRRRFAKHMRVLIKKNARPSRVARAQLSHAAWTSVPEKVTPRIG
jgi:hypothetical protein